MLVSATSATEGKAGLPSNGFERLGAISEETPQFRVHTVPIRDAADEAAGDSFSLLREFCSGFFSGMSFYSTTNNYNSSNSNNNHSTSTTISGNNNAVTNGNQSAAFEAKMMSWMSQISWGHRHQIGFLIPVSRDD